MSDAAELTDDLIDNAASTVWEDFEDDIDRRREFARAAIAALEAHACKMVERPEPLTRKQFDQIWGQHVAKYRGGQEPMIPSHAAWLACELTQKYLSAAHSIKDQSATNKELCATRNGSQHQ